MRLDMMALYSKGEAVFNGTDFTENVAVTSRVVLHGGRRALGESSKDASVIHVLVAGCCRDRVSKVLKIIHCGSKEVEGTEVAVGFSA